MPRAVEPRRRALQPRELAAGPVIMPQCRRRQIIGDAEHRLLVLIRRGGDADRRVPGQGDLARPPAPALIVHRERPPADIVEDRDDELAVRRRRAGERLPLARRPNQARPRGQGIALPFGQIVGDDRIGGEAQAVAGVPGLVERHQHASVDDARKRGAAGDRQGDIAAGAEQHPLAVEDVDVADGAGRVHAALAVAQHEREHAGILRAAPIELLGRIEALPAPQPLDHEAIAGLGHRPRPPFPHDQQRVLVLPDRRLLAVGQARSRPRRSGACVCRTRARHWRRGRRRRG